MCGLFGAITTGYLSFPEARVLYQLGVMASFRGMDSAGIATAYRRKNLKFKFNVVKDIVSSPTFLARSDIQFALHTQGLVACIGHARAATSGAVTVANAHSIQEGHLIAAHNGSINNFDQGKNNLTVNDSRILIQKIAKQGLEDTLDQVGDGAYALTYFDTSTRTLNFVRNNKRTLFGMYNSAGTTLFWSSEREMLTFIKAREFGLFREPFHFEIDQLYTIELGSVELKKREIKCRRYEYESTWTPDTSGVLEVNQPKITTLSYCRNCQREDNYCQCKKTSVPLIPFLPSNSAGSKDMRRYKGYKDIIASVDIMFANPTCQTCNEDKRPEDDLYWTSANSFICSGCMKDSMIYDYASTKRLYRGKLLGVVNATH